MVFNPNAIKKADLIAISSPKQAFYTIWIEKTDERFVVCKESGGKGRVLDRRSWPFDSFEEAEALFNRRVQEKANPMRRSPRKYRITDQIPAGI